MFVSVLVRKLFQDKKFERTMNGNMDLIKKIYSQNFLENEKGKTSEM